MKHLTKTQIDEKVKLLEDVQAKQEELDQAIDRYNRESLALWNRLIDPALDALNTAAQALEEFRSDLHGQMEDYYGEKSEKWQESEAGQAYEAWMSEYSESIEGVELEAPENIETPEVDYGSIHDANDAP